MTDYTLYNKARAAEINSWNGLSSANHQWKIYVVLSILPLFHLDANVRNLTTSWKSKNG